MNRTEFREEMHNRFALTDDVLLDRLFRTFDKDQDGFVSRTEMVEGLSIFLLGTEDEQIDFCFSVYDMTGNGQISREDAFHLLKKCLVQTSNDEDGDEEVKNLVDTSLRCMLDDEKRDRREHIITLEDYRERVKSGTIFIDLLGTVLPCQKHKDLFLEELEESDK